MSLPPECNQFFYSLRQLPPLFSRIQPSVSKQSGHAHGTEVIPLDLVLELGRAEDWV
jgi:hypothetical protein